MLYNPTKRLFKLVERLRVVRDWDTVRWAFAQGWAIEFRYGTRHSYACLC